MDKDMYLDFDARNLVLIYNQTNIWVRKTCPDCEVSVLILLLKQVIRVRKTIFKTLTRKKCPH